MAITREIIVSLAVQKLGHEAVSSLANADALVRAADEQLTFQLPTLLSMGNWRFATKIAVLSKINETPPAPWQVAYLLPSDMIKMIGLYPAQYEWDIFENSRLYAMWDGIVNCTYVYVPSISALPYPFIDYLVNTIAYTLSLTNAQSPEFHAVLKQDMERSMAIALSHQAQNRPNYALRDFPALSARGLGGMIG